jgi:hypothetical protein
MAISETAPNQGTLQVFPDVLLSTSYIMLRPFFTPTLRPSEDGYLNAENWKFGECFDKGDSNRDDY